MAAMPAHPKPVQHSGPKRPSGKPDGASVAQAFAAIGVSVVDHESMPWIPLAPYSADVEVKYFRLDPVRGEMVMLFKASRVARLPECHHTGSAIVYTIEGRWKQAERDWIAGPGSLVHIPAATSQTPTLVGDGESAVVLAVAQGDIIMYRDNGGILAIENWRTAMDRYLAWCSHACITPADLLHVG